MVEYFGKEIAIKFYNRYRGQQICYPMSFYTRKYVLSKIMEEYDGTNLKELARRYEYTERWLMKQIKEQRKDTDNHRG